MLNGFGDAAAVIAEVEQFGARVGHHPADVSDPAQIAEMFAYAEREFGGVDILVNNAGIQHVASVEDFRWNAGTRSLPSTCRRYSTARAWRCRHARQGLGRIVNIASVHGQVGSVGKAAYVAAKHGVIGLTKVVGLETATSNVTCNAICPGWVLTPLVQKQIDDRAASGVDPQQAQHDLLAEKQPSLEFVTPSQLGELVLFLCSEAASQVRGAAWNIDGAGWHNS
ncbi:3-hydroxybutyrate dehydrogenase [Pseudomonas sp. PCH446]